MRVFIISLVSIVCLYAGNFDYKSSIQRYDDRVGKTNVAGYINRITSSIAEQLSQNKNFYDIKETPLAILSIVDMNDFKKTSPITKKISENLIHEMHVRGYKVVDYKAMSNIEIDESGDYLFSRAIKDLKNQRVISYALAGTYSEYREGMVVNCRIIDIKSSIVLSTAQVFIPKRILKKNKRKNIASWHLEKDHNTVIKGK